MERLYQATTLIVLALGANPAAAQSLRGSPASVDKQHRVAVEHDYSFLQSNSQVQRFASRGLLVSLGGNANYELAGVSYPFARPAVKTFVERLSQQYRAACGEPLVVTSLTRPTTKQPRNASDQSVHPAGMAVDLRISRTSKCRSWLERVLLSLETRGVLEATRERFPAHYHVAVFPNDYLAYIGHPQAQKLADAAPEAVTVVASAEEATDELSGGVGTVSGEKDFVDAESAPPAAADAAAAAPESDVAARPQTSLHRVSRGDTLWAIAQRYGISVAELKALNGLNGNRIKAGQRLRVPAGAESQ